MPSLDHSLQAARDAKLNSAFDDYLGESLPPWLRAATPGQVNALRDRFMTLQAVQADLRRVLERLQPLDRFASSLLQRGVVANLAPGTALENLIWRETRRDFGPAPFQDTVHVLPSDKGYFVRVPALQRLMQNFTADASFYEGTALVAAGDDEVVSREIGQLVALCRQVDVGQRYQNHLNELFDPVALDLLAREQRASLAVAVEIEAMHKRLSAVDERFLRAWLHNASARHEQGGQLRVGGLNLLGCRIAGALVFEISGSWAPGSGPSSFNPLLALLVYLPGEPQPLQRFDGWASASARLGSALRQDAVRERLCNRVALADRAAFVMTLAKRLADTATDAEASSARLDGEPFASLARHHVDRIKADARFLAVPTLQADHAASHARLARLADAGLLMLNLVGLLVPVVGALLASSLIVDTLAEVCEGVADWAHGHEHEALEHMLGVAETVAVTAALGLGVNTAARGFARSPALESLEPVLTADGKPRLQSPSLLAYRVVTPAAQLVRLDNGLLAGAGRLWWQDEQAFYEVRRVGQQWELRHPLREEGVHPALRHNGERGWRLVCQRPLEWQGAQRMLGYLWPEAAQLPASRCEQILRVADVDELQLRALLAENRRLPVHLRDTLERFSASARIEAFLTRAEQDSLLEDDQPLFEHCLAQLDAKGRPRSEQLQAIGLAVGRMRQGLLEHLTQPPGAERPLRRLLQRDFPGLPQAYAQRLLEQTTSDQRAFMQARGKVPLALAEQARELLQLARLTRVREAFYLPGSYRDDAVEVALDLLRRKAYWPVTINLELRQGSDSGPVLARLYPQSEALVLVHRDGDMHVYHSDGRRAEIEPGALPEVLAACLPHVHRERLGWGTDDAPDRITLALQGWLPATREALGKHLGMAPIKPRMKPLRRTADGRLGYPLSGRSGGSGARNLLRRRIRSLFPTFDDAMVESHLQELLDLPGSPFTNLLAQERAYRDLCDGLLQWVNAEPRLTAARGRIAAQLRRCWRREGEHLPGTNSAATQMRLSLIAVASNGLPELPGTVTFEHVSSLSLVGLGLQRLPTRFLRAFGQIHWLNLSNNRLTTLPTELSSLHRLRTLCLQNNQIRMDATGLDVLRSLPQIDVLDLSDNPLRVIDVNFTSMARLRRLLLRRTRLRAIPGGIQRCRLLELADLRSNDIAELPAFLRNEPFAFRRRLHLEGNPLPTADLDMLAIPGPAEGAGAVARRGWRAWTEGLEVDAQVQLQEHWEALGAEPGSADFFGLLEALEGTSDFRLVHRDLQRRLRAMLAAMMQDTGLRQALFELATAPRTCVDSVADCFSTLEVRSWVYQAIHDAPGQDTEQVRLEMARRLFRLDRLEEQARVLMQAQAARGQLVDEVEVSLALRIGLATTLDLPGQPRTMRFATIAGVTQADLDRAAEAVRDAEAGPELARDVSRRDFWLEYLHQHHGAAFEAVAQPFWARLEALDAERSALDDAVYLRRMQRLGEEREAATQNLALELTLRALPTPSGLTTIWSAQ